MQIIFMINLLPYTEKKGIDKVRFIRIVNTLLLGVVILLGIVGVLLAPSVITIANRFTLANTQIATLVRDEKIVSDVDLGTLESEVRTVERKLTLSAPSSPIVYAQKVRALAPPGVLVNRISSNGDVLVEVYGTTTGRELLQSFITVLQGDPSVSQVDNPLSNLVKTKEGSFKITVTFKPVK